MSEGVRKVSDGVRKVLAGVKWGQESVRYCVNIKYHKKNVLQKYEDIFFSPDLFKSLNPMIEIINM